MDALVAAAFSGAFGGAQSVVAAAARVPKAAGGAVCGRSTIPWWGNV
jgi:hypothetical protein